MYDYIRRLTKQAALTSETPWRNGSASDSRSEGCVFESRRGQNYSFWKPLVRQCSFLGTGVVVKTACLESRRSQA